MISYTPCITAYGLIELHDSELEWRREMDIDL